MIGVENQAVLPILLLALPGLYFAYRADERKKTVTALLHTLVIASIGLAAASPYINMEEDLSAKPQLTLLADNSRSAELMKYEELEINGVDIDTKVIASGNSSDLRNSIIRQIEPNTAYLAVSDFQSSSELDGLEKEFSSRNSTLSILKPDMVQEASISIKGPTSTVPGASNRYTVKVSSTGEIPKPTLKMDGETIELEKTGNKTWAFNRKFTETGSHTLKASIDVNDRFGSNNNYYLTVHVTEKPEVLSIGDEGRLEDELGEFYDITNTNSLPDDLSDYYAVLLKKDVPEGQLKTYVSKGNGIVYTGNPGKKAMDILPVKASETASDQKGAKIMIVIDISQSTSESGAVKRSKQIAYNLVERLPYNNRVGAIAYNRDAYIIQKPKSLAVSRGQLKDKISRLETSGPSLHHTGILGAKQALNGTGNIIMISDGKIGGLGQNTGEERKMKDAARDLNVRLITVAVGEGSNTELLKEIAELGNGFYMNAEESGKLKFMFNAGGAASGSSRLVVMDSNHFITEGLSLDTSTTLFDDVEPRTGANLLVTNTNGQTFLTSWHYGLGRVAAYSGGGKNLDRVLNRDPRLVTRSASWAVGDPLRKKENWLKISSARRPEKVEVESSKKREGLVRSAENRYTGEIDPDSLGFHSYSGQAYAYNYNPEIEEIGYNDAATDIARATGGEVYSPEEKQQIKNDITKFSNREIVQKQNLSTPLLVLGLIIFLAEVGYRKMEGMK